MMMTLMLIAAVGVSLAGGVLLAYAICLAMFRVFRVHSEVAARQRPAAAAGRVATQI